MVSRTSSFTPNTVVVVVSASSPIKFPRGAALFFARFQVPLDGSLFFLLRWNTFQTICLTRWPSTHFPTPPGLVSACPSSPNTPNSLRPTFAFASAHTFFLRPSRLLHPPDFLLDPSFFFPLALLSSLPTPLFLASPAVLFSHLTNASQLHDDHAMLFAPALPAYPPCYITPPNPVR